MTLSINDTNGQRFGEATSISVHGSEGCGVHILYLRINISVTNLNTDAFISQLNCRIELEESPIKLGNGFIEARPIITFHEYSSDVKFGFNFYLTGKQLEAIEKHRNHNDLKIGVWLSGSTNHKDKFDSFCDKGVFSIPKQEWLETLSAMKYQDTLLFEIPMPEKTSSNGKGLSDLLKRAQNHILNGHYQESVTLCRHAIELIEHEKGDKTQACNAAKKYKGGSRQDMNTQERMLFLREAIKNITHLGAHNGDDFSRQQAQVILGLTVSMLSSPEIGIPQTG